MNDRPIDEHCAAQNALKPSAATTKSVHQFTVELEVESNPSERPIDTRVHAALMEAIGKMTDFEGLDAFAYTVRPPARRLSLLSALVSPITTGRDVAIDLLTRKLSSTDRTILTAEVNAAFMKAGLSSIVVSHLELSNDQQGINVSFKDRASGRMMDGDELEALLEGARKQEAAFAAFAGSRPPPKCPLCKDKGQIADRRCPACAPIRHIHEKRCGNCAFFQTCKRLGHAASMASPCSFTPSKHLELAPVDKSAEPEGVL